MHYALDPTCHHDDEPGDTSKVENNSERSCRFEMVLGCERSYSHREGISLEDFSDYILILE